MPEKEALDIKRNLDADELGRIVTEEIFPDYVQIKEDEARRLSYACSWALRDENYYGAVLTEEGRERFIAEGLTNIPELSPRGATWSFAQSFESEVERIEEIFSEDGLSDGELAGKGKDYLEDFLERFKLLGTIYENFGVDESRLSVPFVHIDHYLKSYLQKVYGGETVVDRLDGSLSEYDQKVEGVLKTMNFEIPEWKRWLEEVVVIGASELQLLSLEFGLKRVFIKELEHSQIDVEEEEVFVFDGDYSYTRLTFVDMRGIEMIIDNLVMNIEIHSGMNDGEDEARMWVGVGEDEKWRMVVVNKGEGFDSEMLEGDGKYGQRAFRFGISSRAGGGYGLGKVHELVSEMGGKVWAGDIDDPFSQNKLAYVAMEVPLVTELSQAESREVVS